MEQVLKFRHNAMDVSSVTAFEHIKGGFRQNTKDVYFVRLLGDNGTLLRDVGNMDAHLSAAMAKGGCVYQRITKLPGLTDRTQADRYSDCYEAWEQGGEQALSTKAAAETGISSHMLSEACRETVRVFAAGKNSFSDSMRKNFVVKLLYWMDQLLKGFSGSWQEGLCVKIVSHNIVKNQEYCFFYFLTLLGMDVLLLQSREDIEPQMEGLGLSKKYRLGDWTNQEFPEWDPKGAANAPLKVHIPERNSKNRNRSQEKTQNTENQSQKICNAPVKVALPDRRPQNASHSPGSVPGNSRQTSQAAGRREKTNPV